MLNDKWDARFLLAACFFAEFSKDPSTKTGAFLANSKREGVGFGFNGFPRGVSDAGPLLADRERKLLRTVHAEVNALTLYGGSCADVTLYVWQPSTVGPSCANCAGPIINRGIRRVVFSGDEENKQFSRRWDGSYLEALHMFADARVVIKQYRRTDLRRLAQIELRELSKIISIAL